MGCGPQDGECPVDTKPAHHVRITQAFELATHEATQQEWESVEQITWDEIQPFLAKLNARNDGYRYRLPTLSRRGVRSTRRRTPTNPTQVLT